MTQVTENKVARYCENSKYETINKILFNAEIFRRKKTTKYLVMCSKYATLHNPLLYYEFRTRVTIVSLMSLSSGRT